MGRAADAILSSTSPVVIGRWDGSNALLLHHHIWRWCNTQAEVKTFRECVACHSTIVLHVLLHRGSLVFNLLCMQFHVNLSKKPFVEFFFSLFSLYICQHLCQQPANQTLNVFPLQLSATLAIPFWQWFLTRFGKKTAVYVGTTVRPTVMSVHHH